MAGGRLQHIVQHYRKQLADHEQAAEHALVNAHAHTLQAIQPALNKLYREIAAAQQSGEPIPPSWLYEQRRLQRIKILIQSQMEKYGQVAETTVGQLQQKGVSMGLQAGKQQLQALKPDDVVYHFGTPHPGAIQSLVGATQKGSPLSDLFFGFGGEAADKASKALITGIYLGRNPRVIAKDVQDALNISRSRALTIARTEMLRAYRDANLETFRSNSSVVRGWVWMSALAERTCAACIAMNGTEHSLDEPMESHVNCRCTQAPLVKKWSEIMDTDVEGPEFSVQSGEDWLDDQDEDMQRAILGNKYDGWSQGQFTLNDIVGRSYSPQWGSSIYEKSLKELVGSA